MWLNILLGIFLLLIAVILFVYFKLKYTRKKQKADFLKIFAPLKNSMPTLEFGSSYGWDTFMVTFQNKEDLSFARKNQLTASFKDRIKSYYNSKFDVDLAVTFTTASSHLLPLND